MVRRAEVTMEETSAGDGVGLGATTQAPEASLTSLGKRGGQTVQRFFRLPLQLVRGRVPARSMKRPSWKGMSSAESEETPKRIWWPLRSWSFLRMRQCRVEQPRYW